MKKLIVLAFISLLALTSCSSVMVRSDYQPNVNFSQFKTYEIRQNDLKLNDIDRARVVNALSGALQAHGLQMSNSNPDLIINVKATHKRIRDIQTSYPFGYGWGWGWGPYWGMGMPYSNTTTDIYNRGALTFDFIDAQTNKLIWQGVGTGISVDNPKAKARQIPEMVDKLFKNYPPNEMARR